MTTALTGRNRINSIDILRGIVMIIMALDHVRDFFYKAGINNAGSVASEPTNLATTTAQLFFTRWITHFCAPAFVLLAGTSIYLSSQKKSKAELSAFLFKRGVWLLLLEATIITLGWTFNPLFSLIILQVIWAIGISMILMAGFVYLPYKMILIIGLVIVFGHNLLDFPSINNGLKGTLITDAAYFSQFAVYSITPNHFVLFVYAFLPWTGIMLLGFCLGKLYKSDVDAAWRRKILFRTGFGLLLLFLLLRFINVYGDPAPWSAQPRGGLFTFLSFLNVTKYPASLQFYSLTIGTALLMLAWLETVKHKIVSVFAMYGRVPLFYYVLHFYFIHTLVVLFFFINGHPTSEIVTPNNPFLFRPPSFGFNLFGVYAIWIFIVVALYPLCKKYDKYKSTHKKWWLSYL